MVNDIGLDVLQCGYGHLNTSNNDIVLVHMKLREDVLDSSGKLVR